MLISVIKIRAVIVLLWRTCSFALLIGELLTRLAIIVRALKAAMTALVDIVIVVTAAILSHHAVVNLWSHVVKVLAQVLLAAILVLQILLQVRDTEWIVACLGFLSL